MSSTGPRRITIAVLFTLLCLIWGSTWLAIKLGLEDLPTFWSAGLRFGLAWLLMTALAPWLRRREGGTQPPCFVWLAVGLLNMTMSFGIVYWSERVLPSGLVALLWSVFPLMVALLGHLFLPGERLRSVQWLGFVTAFGGVCILFSGDLRALGPRAVLTGLVVLIAPFVSAISTTIVKRYGTGASSVLMTRNAIGVAAVLLTACGIVRGEEFPTRWTRQAVLSVIYLALVGTVVTFGIYFWLMRTVPAYKMSLIAFLTPALALALGAFAAGEPVHVTTLVGAAVILTGVFFASGVAGRLWTMRRASLALARERRSGGPV